MDGVLARDGRRLQVRRECRTPASRSLSILTARVEEDDDG